MILQKTKALIEERLIFFESVLKYQPNRDDFQKAKCKWEHLLGLICDENTVKDTKFQDLAKETINLFLKFQEFQREKWINHYKRTEYIQNNDIEGYVKMSEESFNNYIADYEKILNNYNKDINMINDCINEIENAVNQ